MVYNSVPQHWVGRTGNVVWWTNIPFPCFEAHFIAVICNRITASLCVSCLTVDKVKNRNTEAATKMCPQLRCAQDLQMYSYSASFSNRKNETGLTKSPDSLLVCLDVLCFSFWNIWLLRNVVWASYHLMTLLRHKPSCHFPIIKHNNIMCELSRWKLHFCHLFWDPKLIFDSASKNFATFEEVHL